MDYDLIVGLAKNMAEQASKVSPVDEAVLV